MQHLPVLISTDQGQRGRTVAASLGKLGLDAAIVPPGPATLRSVRELLTGLVIVDADHVHGCRTVMLVSELRPVS